MSRTSYNHKFVKAFPDKLDEGILYVSVEFGTAAHRCFCGCGSEVYTRFSPRDWSMKFNGETVSINPSIGNWSFPCQSHYVLSGGHVHWADRWSRERINLGRLLDRQRKERHYHGTPDEAPTRASAVDVGEVQELGLFARIARWLLGR
jgi:hypothetical protein